MKKKTRGERELEMKFGTCGCHCEFIFCSSFLGECVSSLKVYALLSRSGLNYFLCLHCFWLLGALPFFFFIFSATVLVCSTSNNGSQSKTLLLFDEGKKQQVMWSFEFVRNLFLFTSNVSLFWKNNKKLSRPKKFFIHPIIKIYWTKLGFGHVETFFRSFWTISIDMKKPYEFEVWVQKCVF